jgi:hypothetical protein
MYSAPLGPRDFFAPQKADRLCDVVSVVSAPSHRVTAPSFGAVHTTISSSPPIHGASAVLTNRTKVARICISTAVDFSSNWVKLKTAARASSCAPMASPTDRAAASARTSPRIQPQRSVSRPHRTIPRRRSVGPKVWWRHRCRWDLWCWLHDRHNERAASAASSACIDSLD